MRRILIGVVLMTALVAPGSARADHSSFCRDEPGDPTEQGQPILVSGSEVAFVGADATFHGGALVCVGAGGESVNAGVILSPEGDVVVNCSPSNPVEVGGCRMDVVGQLTPGSPSLSLSAVTGNGTVSPPLDVTPGNHTFTFGLAITSGGLVDGSFQVGTSACGATAVSSPVESLPAGSGGGTWGCSTGPLAGMSGELVYAHALAETVVFLTGDIATVLECAVLAQEPPPSTNFTIACAGPFAGA